MKNTLLKNKLSLLSFLILFTACSSNPDANGLTTEFSGTAMTINYTVIVGSKLNSDQKHTIQHIIEATFNVINRIYNKWNPYSEVSKLNQLHSGKKIKISPELEKLFELTDKIHTLSQGRFDPTIEPLQQLWKQKLNQGSIPTEEEIAALVPAVGWEKVHFENGVFYKDHHNTSLDFSGIAKGLGVDLLIKALINAGYPNIFVEWGGEIAAMGEHPAHRPWHVYISRLNDVDPSHAIAHMDLNNQALATSGDYLQNWTVEKDHQFVNYFHVINPKTYRPLEMNYSSIASASVLGNSCAFVDGLATAAMMFPTIEESQQWAEKLMQDYPELKFWIISRKNSENIDNPTRLGQNK